MSVTALERWAACPFEHFLRDVLGVSELPRADATEAFSAVARGNLLHAVLDELVRDHAPITSDAEWSPEARDRARALAQRHLQRAADAGVHRPALTWELELRSIVAELERVLDTDDELRATRRRLPVATELAFGHTGGMPSLELVCGDRPVRVHGRIDRVDRDVDGGFHIVDYKTGRLARLDARDPTAAGTKLQLAAYALALRQLAPASPVTASYWYTTARGPAALTEFDLDDVRSDAERVMTSALHGIASGVFPAVPVDPRGAPTHQCTSCAYRHACPADRARRWEQHRADPACAPFRALRERAA